MITYKNPTTTSVTPIPSDCFYIVDGLNGPINSINDDFHMYGDVEEAVKAAKFQSARHGSLGVWTDESSGSELLATIINGEVFWSDKYCIVSGR